MIEHFTNFKSSNVKSLTYDPAADRLTVEFQSGTRYSYDAVPAKKWHELRGAKSIGGFMAKHVVGQHESKRLEKPA